MQTVDILLATYNGAEFLPEQLASLDAQTHSKWRLLVRDDGSTDCSLDMVRDWAERAGRDLVVIEDGEPRVGPTASFARLLTRSSAPLFAFCDQDDVWHSDKLTRLVAAVAGAGEGVVLAHCDLAVVDRNLAPVAASFWRQQSSDPDLRTATPGARVNMFIQNPVTGCAMLGNAALRDAMLPLPDATAMHDWWAALTAAYRGRIVTVDAPLVRYRQHDRNAAGAKGRSVGAMVARFAPDPGATIERTRTIFDLLSRQAAATRDRFGDTMTPAERRFVRRFAEIGAGLGRPGAWLLAIWALAAKRRWPLAAYLVSQTVGGRGRRTGSWSRRSP